MFAKKIRSCFYRSVLLCFLGIESIGEACNYFNCVYCHGGKLVMSSWKRGFLEIIAEILESLMSSPLKKTHITFKCNLDSRAVTKYLSLMISIGLVEKSKKDSSYYVITQKGINYRNQFHSFVSIMENDLENLTQRKDGPQEIIADLKMRKC